MTKSNGDESQVKEEGLMKQIEQAKKKGDIGSLNFLKSELAKHEREYDIALEHCQEALDIDPENPKYLVQMGSILNRLRRFQNAIEFFDRVLEIDDENIEALRGKGFALSRLQKNQEAIEYYDRVLNLDLTDFEAWSLKGTALSFLGEHEKALKCFEKALKIRPNSYKTLRSKAFALFRSGKLKDAINVFDRLLERSPTDLNTIQGKATVCFYGKAYEEAIETFKEAVDLLEERKESRIRKEKYKEKKVDYLRKIGASFSALEKDEEALLWFDRALKIDPRDYNALRDKGVSLSRLGRRKEALDCFEKALQINPKNFPAWREKGAVLSNLNRDNEAINCYRKAIHLNPNDYHSYRQMGVSLAKLGYHRKAKAVLDIALEINPNDVETLREIGFNHFVQFEDDDAIKQCRQVLEVKPTDPLAHLVLARILETRGMLKRSLFHYNEFRKNTTSQQRRRYLDQVDLKIQKVEQRIQREREIPRPYDVREKIAIEFESRLIDTVFEDIKEKEEKFGKLLILQRSIKDNNFPSFLAILRRWNSYTPLLPPRGGLDRGGGYYLYHNGKGIVIDPGCNFLMNFYQEGFNFVDIDAVIVTHAHIDHTMDLESILTLIHRLNEKIKDEAKEEAEDKGKTKKEAKHLYEEKVNERTKRIDLFLNKGTYQKYEALICCMKMSYIDGIYELEAGENLPLPEKYGNIKLFAMKAKHDEILDSQYCLGYVIEVDGRRIGITGDTGWIPDGSIGDQYKELSPDLMVTHIGSIKKEELGYIYATSQEEKDACFYSTHLGLLGVASILDVVRPELAIISEFGEELKDQRIHIAQRVSKATGVRCLPGDIGLYIRISDLAVFCEASKQFIPYEDICYEPLTSKLPELEKNPKIHYYWEDLPYREVQNLKFDEEIRRKPLPERIEERKGNLKR